MKGELEIRIQSLTGCDILEIQRPGKLYTVNIGWDPSVRYQLFVTRNGSDRTHLLGQFKTAQDVIAAIQVLK